MCGYNFYKFWAMALVFSYVDLCVFVLPNTENVVRRVWPEIRLRFHLRSICMPFLCGWFTILYDFHVALSVRH